jgi:LysW-gamma-L-lysine carboxypeptidase
MEIPRMTIPGKTLAPAEEIGLLAGLLECYSPTGQEAEAVSYLVQHLERLGFQAHIDPAGNAVGTIGTGEREILLLGHIDTVPGAIPVSSHGAMLWGRGAVDAKGPLAGFVCAARRVRVTPGWRITVIGAVGEEGDSRGARYLLRKPPPEMLVIGEPSGWDRIALGYKGSAWFRCRLQRPEVHTASGMGTASEAAVSIWNSLQAAAAAYNAGKTRLFETVTPTLQAINTTRDGFSQRVEMKINMRLPEGLNVREAQKMLAGAAGEAQVELEDGIQAYRAPKNTPLVRALLAAIREAGGQPGFTVKTGTSDMNLVGPVWNCPAAAYGAGDSHLDHTPDEHIVLREYQAGIRILADALQRLVTEG